MQVFDFPALIMYSLLKQLTDAYGNTVVQLQFETVL